MIYKPKEVVSFFQQAFSILSPAVHMKSKNESWQAHLKLVKELLKKEDIKRLPKDDFAAIAKAIFQAQEYLDSKADKKKFPARQEALAPYIGVALSLADFFDELKEIQRPEPKTPKKKKSRVRLAEATEVVISGVEPIVSEATKEPGTPAEADAVATVEPSIAPESQAKPKRNKTKSVIEVENSALPAVGTMSESDSQAKKSETREESAPSLPAEVSAEPELDPISKDPAITFKTSAEQDPPRRKNRKKSKEPETDFIHTEAVAEVTPKEPALLKLFASPKFSANFEALKKHHLLLEVEQDEQLGRSHTYFCGSKSLRVKKKAGVLKDFINAIDECKTTEALMTLMQDFYAGKDDTNSVYNVLNKGQNVTTRFFHLRTTTVGLIDKLNENMQPKEEAQVSPVMS